METEGSIIQQLITNKGYGQGEFADKIGVARPSMNSYIKGRKPIGKVIYKRIADGLGLSLGVFMFLIKLDVPLDHFKLLQEIAEVKQGQTINVIKAMLKIHNAQTNETFPLESAPLLSHLADAFIKLAESLDK